MTQYVTLSTPYGVEFKVDKADLPLIEGKSYLKKDYVCVDGVALNRLIMGVSDNRTVRFRNGDTNDYRRANLEVCVEKDDVVAFVRAYVKENLGVPPTFREVCEGCGISSVSMASKYLEELVAMGKLVRALPGRSSRGYTVPEMLELVGRLKP